tara:strand:- start:1661 stop:2395 length:735 start_codon:yes stop_codon:yes gene_type:complete
MKSSIYIFLLIVSANLFSHSIEDVAKWKKYYRVSYIVNENHDYGLGGYFRVKRTTRYTFKDLRVFMHFVEGDSYKKIRYKDSSKFRDWDRFYNYTTVAIDQNSKIGVNLRYHGNQGVGLFVKNFKNGHINAEIGLAYDISDYLNDSAKTSYFKNGIYWDQKFSDYEIKFEIENYKQITDIIIDDLSRTEILFEVYFPIQDNLRVILGYEYEDFNNSVNSINSSVFLSIAYYDALDIDKLKKQLF